MSSIRALAQQVLEQTRKVEQIPVSVFQPIAHETVKQTPYLIDNKGLSCFTGHETKPQLVKHETAQAAYAYDDEHAALIEAGTGLPRAWADAYAGLCQAATEKPSPVMQQAVDDSGRFIDRWGKQAVAMGWKPEWIFCNTPPMAGLAFCILGGDVVAISETTAAIRHPNGYSFTCRLTRKDVKRFGCYWETTHN